MSKILILALLLIAVSSLELCSEDVSDLNAQSDSYQWPQYFQDLIFQSKYHEWWFFTFFDEDNDIGMAFSFGLSDPKNSTDGSCGISNMVWTNVLSEEIQEPALLNSDFHISNCFLSEQNADYSSPAGGIKVVSPDGKTYNVKMQLENLVMDLNYTQLVAPCRQTENFAPVAVLDWQSYMISARVVGTVIFNNVTYNITGKGYHDKNWGSWPSSKFNWIWSQYNDPTQGLGIVWGSYKIPVIDTYVGYMFLRIENSENTIIKKLGTLCLDSFDLNVLENSTDAFGVSYASHLQLTIKQLVFGNLKVQIDIQKKVAYQNPGGIGLDLRVFEMISEYNVQVYQGDDMIINSQGYGFNEWSELISAT